MLHDEISGAEVPVTLRIECAGGRFPQYILIGANEAGTDNGGDHESRVRDGQALMRVLYDNLPWPAYYSLIRACLLGCARNCDVFYGTTRTPEIESALNLLITALDSELKFTAHETKL